MNSRATNRSTDGSHNRSFNRSGSRNSSLNSSYNSRPSYRNNSYPNNSDSYNRQGYNRENNRNRGYQPNNRYDQKNQSYQNRYDNNQDKYRLTDAKDALKNYYDTVDILSEAQANLARSTKILEEKIEDKAVFLDIIRQTQLPAVQVSVRTIEEEE